MDEEVLAPDYLGHYWVTVRSFLEEPSNPVSQKIQPWKLIRLAGKSPRVDFIGREGVNGIESKI